MFRWDRFSSGCGYFTARGEYATPTPTYTSTPSSSKSQSLRYFSLLPVSFYFSSHLLPIVVVHLQYPWSIKPIKKQTFVSFWFQRASLQLGYSSDGIEAQAFFFIFLSCLVVLVTAGHFWKLRHRRIFIICCNLIVEAFERSTAIYRFNLKSGCSDSIDSKEEGKTFSLPVCLFLLPLTLFFW